MVQFRYNQKEKAQIIEEFLKCGQKYRTFSKIYSERIQKLPPNIKTVKNIMAKFREGLLTNESSNEREQGVRVQQNIDKVRSLVGAHPRISQRNVKKVGNLQKRSSSLWSTICTCFHTRSKSHRLMKDASARQTDSCNEMFELIEDGSVDVNKIWFCDECHFWMSVYVNKQNYRFWGTEPLHMVVEEPLHPAKVTVWCAVSSVCIINPYFFF